MQNFVLSFPLDDASCTTAYFFSFVSRLLQPRIATFLIVYYYFACAYEESNDNNTLDLKLGLATASLLLLIKMVIINRFVLTITHLISEGLNLNLIKSIKHSFGWHLVAILWLASIIMPSACSAGADTIVYDCKLLLLAGLV